MKHSKPVLPSTLASLLLISSGLGWGLNPAEARAAEPDHFQTWAEQQGYRCQAQVGAFLCRRMVPPQETDAVKVEKNIRSNTVRLRSNRRGLLEAGTVLPTQSLNTDQVVLTANDTLDLTLLVKADIKEGQSNTILIPRNSKIEGKLIPHEGGVRFDADRLVLANGQRFAIDAYSQVIFPQNGPAIAAGEFDPSAESEFDASAVGTPFFGESLLSNPMISEAAGMLIGSIMNSGLDLTDLTSLFDSGLDMGILGQLGSILGGSIGGDLLGGSLGGDLLGGGGDELLGGESEAQDLPEQVQGLEQLVVVYPDQDLDLTLASDLQVR